MLEHGPLYLDTFIDPVFQENAYLLWTDDGPEAWIIDPSFEPQPTEIADLIAARKLEPGAILLTHCHVDHIAGVSTLKRKYENLPLWAPTGEEHMLADPAANLSLAMGVPVVAEDADRLIEPGSTLTLGPLTWQVLDVRGHSPGGQAFYCIDAGIVICGDTLFAGGIGRFDFPGSSEELLMKNIREQLLSLPDETTVYPGHGPATTIGRERATNSLLHGII